jgi:hypothetical protein
MKIDEIKSAITRLPDSEIQPLLEWLRDYYDGPVWDRQIEADVLALGPSEFFRRLNGGEDGLERLTVAMFDPPAKP